MAATRASARPGAAPPVRWEGYGGFSAQAALPRRPASAPARGSAGACPCSGEVHYQCIAKGGRNVEDRPVLRMIDPDGEPNAGLERLSHFVGELEAQEGDRGGLLFILPLQILVGDGPYTPETPDLDPDLVLDADQLRKPPLALLRVRILKHHGGLEV